MKPLLLSIALLGAFGFAGQRPLDQLPDHILKATQSPEMIRARNEYQKLTIARPSPASFLHIDWSRIKIKGTQNDLRSTIDDYGLAIRSQGNRGTCSVFALTFCQEYLVAKTTGKKNLDFSEEYLNVIGDIAAGSVQDGGFYKDLNTGYQLYGHIDESELPYHDPMAAGTAAKGKSMLKQGMATKKFTADFIKDWDKTKGASDAQVKTSCDFIDKDLPVAVGLLWPANGKMQKSTYVGVEMMIKVPRADTIDGHSVVLVGYHKNAKVPGGGYFIFRNSWGAGWGDKGYGYMTFDYVKNYANDLLAYH